MAIKKIGFSDVTGYAWTVPADWNSASNTIEVIGAGGSINVIGNPNQPSGGGGGGAYASISNLTLTPGSTIYVQAASTGDAWVNSLENAEPTQQTTGVLAKAGSPNNGVTGGSGGGGGGAGGSIGTTTFPGGIGGAGSTNPVSSGGGGGSAGPNGAGRNGGNGDTTQAGNEGGGGGGGAGGTLSTDGTNGSANGGAGGSGPYGTGGGAGDTTGTTPGTSGTVNTGGGGGGGTALSQGGAGANGSEYGAISWYADTSVTLSTGELIKSATDVSTGLIPDSFIVNSSGEFLYMRSRDGTIVQYSIDQTTGALSSVAGGTVVFTNAQGSTSDMLITPDGRFLYITSFGANIVGQYSINQTTGVLTQITTPIATGSGAWRMAIHPLGTFLYVINTSAPSISQYSINQTTGELTQIATLIVADGIPSYIIMHPTGKFLYTANKNFFAVLQYSINQTTGELTQIGTSVNAGNQPEGMVMHPTGKFLYVVNTLGVSVSQYSINQTSGELTQIAAQIFVPGQSAKNAICDPAGKFLYFPSFIVDSGTPTLNQFSINQTTGELTTISSPPTIPNQSIGLTTDSNGRFLYLTNSTTNSVSQYSINRTTGALTKIRSPIVLELVRDLL